MNKSLKFVIGVSALIGLSACSADSEKACYEAQRAVAETAEKVDSLIKSNAETGLWTQAMHSAIDWKQKACKK